MTASLFVTGTRVLSVGRRRHGDGPDSALPVVDVAHAVARPVVDGLEVSVCGVLVTASAGEDWLTMRHGPRCEECSRIAG